MDEAAALLCEAEAALAQVSTEEALCQTEARFLGRKGAVTTLLARLGSLPHAERPAFGKQVNQLKVTLEHAVARRREIIRAAQLSAELECKTDVSLPGRRRSIGHLHPITLAIREATRIFAELGFEVAEGPQIETEFHNFEALNIPRDHPARDMQDTFYISSESLLRTHTSPVQVRVMRSAAPPIRIIVPGVVYRRDDDPTHSPMFHQIEGLLVDSGVSFAQLKGVLHHFTARFFDSQLGVRLRPSYFPFVEPGAEVDIECVFCRGRGCRTCKQSGWLEIAGCGMVHPAVFEAVGYDPEHVSGFAFGMGVERIAMLRHGIRDIRLFYEGDVRFLEQFR